MTITQRDIQVRDLAAAPVPARWLARVSAAVLSIAVAVVHVIDQGGIPGAKDPSYMGTGYHLLEIAAVLVAAWLLARPTVAAWVLALGVGAGPFLGYLLSRGPGLPGYTDDRGNWGEPLGLVSLAVELALIVSSATVLLRARRTELAASR
jgi:peptidoglycan/LPS O-acetylase OafA/YrhL